MMRCVLVSPVTKNYRFFLNLFTLKIFKILGNLIILISFTTSKLSPTKFCSGNVAIMSKNIQPDLKYFAMISLCCLTKVPFKSLYYRQKLNAMSMKNDTVTLISRTLTQYESG